MKIEHRDASLKYPPAIGAYRVRVVLDWLLEFRFSSLDILAYRIGAKCHNDAYKFFKKLCDEGVIQPFINVHTRTERYFMLAAGGVAYLEAEGRDVSKAITRVSHLARYSKLLHDKAVQSAIVTRLNGCSEVIWDKHIELGDDRPDALMYSKKGWWVALEYERFRKERRRIYMSFVRHAQALIDKRYSGIYYLFAENADMEFYKGVLQEKEWPRYERQPKSGVLKELDSVFIPDEYGDVRGRFIFSHEPIQESLLPRLSPKKKEPQL